MNDLAGVKNNGNRQARLIFNRRRISFVDGRSGPAIGWRLEGRRPNMLDRAIAFIRQRLVAGRLPEGERGIRLLGHRRYVGGRWEHIGRLQFEFLVGQGLKPSDVFLDVACGALRGGVHFIRYLDAGGYLGLDKERSLIDLGLERELGAELMREKRPEFVVSDRFEFERFTQRPRYALALSLFTHLNEADIRLCLRKLRDFVEPGHRFYATFFEGRPERNRARSHSLDHFEYTREQLLAFGAESGWEPEYLGDWGHPRGQRMMRYTAV